MHFHAQQSLWMPIAAMVFACLAVMPIGCKSACRNIPADQTITYATPYDAPSPKLSRDDLLDMDRPFTLLYAIGGFPNGYNQLIVDSTGRARYITPAFEYETVEGRFKMPVRTVYRSTEFRLTELAIRNLRKELADTGFQSLQPAYINSKIADGTMIYINVIIGNQSQSVYCANHFPISVRSLRAYFESVVIAPNTPVHSDHGAGAGASYSSRTSLQLD